MKTIRHGHVLEGAQRSSIASLLVLLGGLAGTFVGVGATPLVDAPVVWYDDDDAPIELPEERDPNVLWDGFHDSVVLPTYRFIDFNRWVRRVGTAFGGDHVVLAHNVNALDEVPNSSWFTNRIGLFPMSPEQVARGVGPGTGPDRSGPWTVISAKTQGVTPGFNIVDARGDRFVIKFDPPGLRGTTTTAGVIVARLLHAAGYNVPDDVTVTFRREDLRIGNDVQITMQDGSRRRMQAADLDAILASVDRLPDGAWFAISSRFLEGTPVGPFNYIGTREDDPNDRIPHQHRRELRGLELIAAWVNHFDTKQNNTLDMYVETGQGGFLKHYLIDFASTLGCGANGLVPRYGWEYTVDLPATLGRIVTLGLVESPWRELQRPVGLEEVGFWVADGWDPEEFKPLQPNSAFVNRTGRDGYWATKIITAFRDEHIDAVVATAGYRDPQAAAYVARILKQRRDIIGRSIFDDIPPLDFFQWRGRSFTFRDLGAERGLSSRSPRYRLRMAVARSDRDTGPWTDWILLEGTELDTSRLEVQGILHADSESYPFLAVELCVDRPGGWSSSVRVFAARASRRIVAVER
jgi:hypothetical protein